MVDRISAGILLFRHRDGALEVLLGHPGGPWFARKDAGHWSIPKGEGGSGEPLEAVARREFEEETGHPVANGPLLPLGRIVQKGGKVVHAWAVEGDLDPDVATSNTFPMEWPPGSDRWVDVPEIDRVAWFGPDEARARIKETQRVFVDRLEAALAAEVRSPATAGTADMARPSEADRVELRATGATAVVDAAVGGRIARLMVDDLDLLVTEGDGPLAWGAYPMVPWAGRLRAGRLEVDGLVHELPLTMPPHAIHGTTWDQPWQVIDRTMASVALRVELAPPWPFGGHAIHRVAIRPDRLEAALEVHAGAVPMPAIVGWHPWFPRRLATGEPVEIDLRAGAMLERGPDGIPTGRRVDVPPGPWDDTFVDVASWPVVRWRGALAIEIGSTGSWWTVYTERAEGVCVEPQTGPPNGLATGEATLVRPGQPLVASMTLAWRRERRG